MPRLDYSSWNNIELSDDEDSVHPFIERASLFQIRHKVRLHEMQEREKERLSLENDQTEYRGKLLQFGRKVITRQPSELSEPKFLKLKQGFIQKQHDLNEREKALKKKDAMTPWNIDTICKDGFSKAFVNKYVNTQSSDEKDLEGFVVKYKKEVQHFGMLRRAADSCRYLQANPHLICENSASYLFDWCMKLEIEEKSALMEHVARQAVILELILKLGKQMKTDPVNCFESFFKRLMDMQPDEERRFNCELDSFIKTLKDCANDRIKMSPVVDLGPGGLHPAEVMKTLPPEVQDCFMKQDVELLRRLFTTMDPALAKHHMKRCIDSGLWEVNKVDDSQVASTSGSQDTQSLKFWFSAR